MFYVEYDEDDIRPEMLSIYISRQAASDLAKDLLALATTKKETASCTYFSESWGDGELSETPAYKGHRSVKGLKIYLESD